MRLDAFESPPVRGRAGAGRSVHHEGRDVRRSSRLRAVVGRTFALPLALALLLTAGARSPGVSAQDAASAPPGAKVESLREAAQGNEEGPSHGFRRPRIRVVPRIGLFSPDTYFYEEFKNFAGDGLIEWTTGSLGRAVLAGFGVEAVFDGMGLQLRGEVARSFEGWLSAAHGVLVPRVYFEPPEVVTTWFDLPASVTLLSVQAILPVQFTFRGVRPFALLGYAGKWYGFGPPTRENSVDAIFPSDGWTASVDLGGGLTFRLLGVDLEAQVRDNINHYWGKTQHDLLLSGGVAWAVR